MNKLFDYLVAGRPIVMASTAVKNPVAEAQAGLTRCRPARPRLWRKLFCRWQILPLAERQRIGIAGREYVERNHSFTQLSLPLAEALDTACVEQGVK